MADQTLHSPLPSGNPFSRPPTPSGVPLRVGFSGLGAIGRLVARNLARHLHRRPDAPPMLLHNRTPARAHALAAELGPDVACVAEGGLQQLARECDVIVTSLADDAAVRAVYGQFAEALKDSHHERRKIFVDMSTIYPTLAGELDALISRPHTHFISAPVFGAPPAADAAQLIIAMAGDVKSKREIAYLFVPAIGKKVIDLGGNVEKAPTMKLIGNSLILGSIEIIGESMTLAEKSGVGADHVQELIKDLFPSAPWVGYGHKILNDLFDGTQGFHIDGGIKDATHIRAVSAAHNAPMPVVDVAYQHLLTARALHAAQGARAAYPVLDWSALAAGSRVAAGLDGLDSSEDPGRVLSQD